MSEQAEPVTQTDVAVELADIEIDVPRVGIIMGSKSDMDVMDGAASVLRDADVRHEVRVMSAHRQPELVAEYCKNARLRGLRVIIAGAGLSAALPGVAAAHTDLPVIGVPLSSRLSAMGGLDAILSVVQMPPGVPVARRRPGQRQERRAPGTADPAKLRRGHAVAPGESPPVRARTPEVRRARGGRRGMWRRDRLRAARASRRDELASSVATGGSQSPTATTPPATHGRDAARHRRARDDRRAAAADRHGHHADADDDAAGAFAEVQVRVLGAILRPAGTPAGRQRRRARLTMRVQATNEAEQTVTIGRPVLAIGKVRVGTDTAADTADAQLGAIAAGATKAATLRFELAGDATEKTTIDRRARLIVAGRSLPFRLKVGSPVRPPATTP